MIRLLSLFKLGRPARASVTRFYEKQLTASVYYTPEQRKSRFLTFQEHRQQLGCGPQCWEHARTNLSQWKMFPRSHFLLHPDVPEISKDSTAAVCMRIAGGQPAGVWITCGCRISQVIDEESNGKKRFGFTYQTLRDHVASGQETFLVEYDTASGEVSYHIFSDSLPRYLWLYPLRPFIHAMQISVKKLSGRAIQSAVAETASADTGESQKYAA